MGQWVKQHRLRPSGCAFKPWSMHIKNPNSGTHLYCQLSSGEMGSRGKNWPETLGLATSDVNQISLESGVIICLVQASF